MILHCSQTELKPTPFPRTRGDDPMIVCWPLVKNGLFPAPAGMILGINNSGELTMTFPRTRGDDPIEAKSIYNINNFSPHPRG